MSPVPLVTDHKPEPGRDPFALWHQEVLQQTWKTQQGAQALQPLLQTPSSRQLSLEQLPWQSTAICTCQRDKVGVGNSQGCRLHGSIYCSGFPQISVQVITFVPPRTGLDLIIFEWYHQRFDGIIQKDKFTVILHTKCNLKLAKNSTKRKDRGHRRIQAAWKAGLLEDKQHSWTYYFWNHIIE